MSKNALFAPHLLPVPPFPIAPEDPGFRMPGPWQSAFAPLLPSGLSSAQAHPLVPEVCQSPQIGGSFFRPPFHCPLHLYQACGPGTFVRICLLFCATGHRFSRGLPWHPRDRVSHGCARCRCLSVSTRVEIDPCYPFLALAPTLVPETIASPSAAHPTSPTSCPSRGGSRVSSTCAPPMSCTHTPAAASVSIPKSVTLNPPAVLLHPKVLTFTGPP